MKTEVIMKRQLFNQNISQKSLNGFLSATDLVQAGNIWRIQNGKEIFNLKNYIHTKSTKEFIAELEKQFGRVKINSKGKNSHTWVHPFLFIDLALAISPHLKIEVYSWLTDHLLKYRNDSGDSYKKMAGALYLNINNKSLFKDILQKTANRIKLECKVKDWQTATEDQLKLRDKIQENIALLTDVLHNIDQVVEIAIKKAKE
jgi:hypothetical protein